MGTLTATVDQYELQKRFAALAVLLSRRFWGRVDVSDITGSWDAQVNGMLAALAALQERAATASAGYVQDALDEQGIVADPVRQVNPAAFAGVASDGRSLRSLLDQPRVRSLTQISRGVAPDDAIYSAGEALERIALTQVRDAGRVAAGVDIASRPAVTVYVRALSPPSCARCAVLAGREYKWNRGFDRHPRCDCVHIPTTVADARGLMFDSRAYFDSLDEAGQDRLFTKAGARAIRDGADVGQVVNARAGMSAAGDVTTVGTTKRSLAGVRLREVQAGRRRVTRLTPEAIYRQAGDDRAAALNLLWRNGYLL